MGSGGDLYEQLKRNGRLKEHEVASQVRDGLKCRVRVRARVRVRPALAGVLAKAKRDSCWRKLIKI